MTPGAALITGAGKRIGRAFALDLAAQGWAVAVHYNASEAEAAAVAAQARALGAQAETVQADLLDRAAAEGLVDKASTALGRPLTLLINNASIFEHDDIASADRESWDRHMDSNLWAPFRLTQHFAAQAPEAERDAEGLPLASACVVNMIDQRVWKPTPEFMSYSLAKAALWAFTRTAAQGLAPDVRVNAIGPGPTMQGPRQSAAHFAAQRAGTVLGRGANTAEICAALGYFLDAPAVTGQLLCVDGGQHLAWRTPDVRGVE